MENSLVRPQLSQLWPLALWCPPWEVRDRKQSLLTTACPLLLGHGVLGVGVCLPLHHWLWLIRLVVLRGDQLHQALVAHVGGLLDA